MILHGFVRATKDIDLLIDAFIRKCAASEARHSPRLGYARQSVQRTTDSLTSKFLLRSVPNPDHKKAPLLELTKLGRDALDRIIEEAEAFHSQVVRHVGARELLDAERFLRNLCNILDPTKSR